MRTIKFRAWDKLNKCWVPINGQDPYTLKQLADDDLFSYHKEIHPISSRWQDYEWVQFTGLLDKNGKEIYEGDIVRNTRNVKGVVVWGNAGFILDLYAMYPRRANGALRSGNGYSFFWKIRRNIKWEVIGNIYENPELLKV